MEDDVENHDYEDFLPNQVIKTLTCKYDWDCTFGLYCNGEFCLCPRDCKYIKSIDSCDCGEIEYETPILPIVIGVVFGFFIVAGWSLVIAVLIRSHVEKKRNNLKDHENQRDSSQNYYTQKPQVNVIPTIKMPSNNSSYSSRHSRSHRSHSRSPTPQRYDNPRTSHSRSPNPHRHAQPQNIGQINLSPFDCIATDHLPAVHRRHSLNPNISNQNIDQCALAPRRHSFNPTSNQDVSNRPSHRTRRKGSSRKHPEQVPLPYTLHPMVQIQVTSETPSSSINNIISPSAPPISSTSQDLHNPPYPIISTTENVDSSISSYTFGQTPLPPNTPPPPYCEENYLRENNKPSVVNVFPFNPGKE